jgi:uncharacterized protein (TIGR02996 family)
MDDEAAFRRAIAEAPADDALRLVYADWCDEHGDPDRAEFIRLQFEAERHEEWTPARMDLDERADALLARNRDRWLRDVPSWALNPDGPPGAQSFRRGFLNRVSVKAENFFASSAELFATAPVREVRIGTIRDGGVALAGHPGLGRIEKAEIGFAETPVNLPAFLSSPHLSGLVGLELALHGPPHPGASFWTTLPMLDDGGARAIAGCAGLARLRALGVPVGTIGPDGIGALAESPHLSSLVELDIRANPVGDEGLIRLARSPLLPRLTELDLYGTRVGDRGLRAALAAGPTRLRGIHLGRHQDCPITDAGVRAFSRCEALAGLRKLDLSSWPLTRARVRAIARSPHLAGLRVLDLGGCGIDDQMAVELARSPYLRNLRSLDLQNNRIGARGIAALAGSPVLATVTNLVLYNNPGMGDAGAVALAESEYVGELRRLCLVTTGFGLGGLRAVAASPRLGQLRELDVQSSPFGDEGGRALCESPLLNRITCLAVYNCGLGADVTAALRARFGAALRV